MRILPLVLTALLWATLADTDPANASRASLDQRISSIHYDGNWTEIRYAVLLPRDGQECDEEVCEQ